jgi:hypothetical protein
MRTGNIRHPLKVGTGTSLADVDLDARPSDATVKIIEDNCIQYMRGDYDGDASFGFDEIRRVDERVSGESK